MNIGDIVSTTAFRAEFGRKGGEGGWASYRAPKGERLVFLLLGSAPTDGSAPLDAEKVLNALGWTFTGDLDPAETDLSGPQGTEAALSEQEAKQNNPSPTTGADQ